MKATTDTRRHRYGRSLQAESERTIRAEAGERKLRRIERAVDFFERLGALLEKGKRR